MKAFTKCTHRHLGISLVHLLLYSFRGVQQFSLVQISFASWQKPCWLFHICFMIFFCYSFALLTAFLLICLGTLYRNPIQIEKLQVYQLSGSKLWCIRKERIPSVRSKHSGKEAVSFLWHFCLF